MRVCSILELDATRCHWPLGKLHEVAVQFCGGNAAPGRRYCLHHLRIGRA
jgi:GcrA cell cycle regulator